MAHHDLKIHRQHFVNFLAGRKPWEMRVNDRDFQVDDTITLHEFDPIRNVYTGDKSELRRITYVMRASEYPAGGPDLCIFTHERAESSKPGPEEHGITGIPCVDSEIDRRSHGDDPGVGHGITWTPRG